MGPSSCKKTSSGLPLILHYGELYNYFIIYYSVIIIEIKCTTNVMCLGFPGGAVVKNPPANAGDTGSSPGPGRSHMPQSN